MGKTYSFNRRRGMQACMGAVMVLLAAAFLGLGLIFPVLAVRIFSTLVGLGVGYLALSLILDIFTPDPILAIGPEGIRFLPFSPAFVPWSDISSVTVSQGFYYDGGGITSADGKFAIAYAVGTPAVYPKRGGISAVARAMMANNTIRLNTGTLINASYNDLIAAIREHYRGRITELPTP